MNTQLLVQASAKVVQITELAAGDVYKRLEESTYSGAELKYGVVFSVLYNGEDAVIQAIEYKVGYREVKTELKTFSGTSDLKLFNCTPDEVREHLAEAVADIEQEVERKQKDLDEAIRNRDRVHEIVTEELTRKLTAPKTTTPSLSQ